MSTRHGKGKVVGTRPRNHTDNSNGVDEGPVSSEAESNYVTSNYMDTNASLHHKPSSESHWDSLDTDSYTDTSMARDHAPQLHSDHSMENSPSSSRNVRRKKNSKERKKDDSWVLKERMPGGPRDIRLLKSYGGHVAVNIWNGVLRGVLVGDNRTSDCRKLASWKNNMNEEVLKLVDDTRWRDVSLLVDCLFDHLDIPLLSAFVERWQPDTNTFHLPFGEMTITLHDVFHILGIPVEGRLVECEGQTTAGMIVGVSGLVQKNLQQMYEEGVYQHGGILTSSFIDSCSPGKMRTPAVEASGFLMATLGTTLFPDKSKTRVNPQLYTLVSDLDMVHTYSWGSATLAFLYRQLGIGSRSQCKILGGCLSLLQAWIYEYFHKFRPQHEQLTVEPNMPRILAWDVKLENKHNIRLETFRKLLDDCTPDQVTWLPFGPDQHVKVPRTSFEGYICYFDIIEPYMSDRVLRQLGFKQSIPKPVFGYDEAYRPSSSHRYLLKVSKDFMILWHRFSQLGLKGSMRASDLSNAVTDNYMIWYMTVSHPFSMPLVENNPHRSAKWYWERLVEMSMDLFKWNLDEVDPQKLRDLLIRQRELMLKYFMSRGAIPPQDPPEK